MSPAAYHDHGKEKAGQRLRRGRTVDHIRDMLKWLKPGSDLAHVSRQTRLNEDLRLTAEDGLALVAMIEALSGRTYGWERELTTLGDLLDYLASQGIGSEAPDL